MQTNSPSDVDEVRKIIEQHNANLCRWYAAGDVEALVNVFAEDCWVMPPHLEPVAGREALRNFWQHSFQLGRWQFTLDTQDVVVSGPLAVERGRYHLTFPAATDQGGAQASEDRGNYVVMWRRDPGGQWRAVWDAPVSTLPVRE